ncbi:4-azaleucine resistance transporter AzlC [Mycolicibacterium sp. BK607]|nr:4-azaleucine resistance transporter AzlC [Mycolicibacterium sp. BK607]
MHQAGATGGLRHSAFSDAARDAGTLWLGLFALGIGFGMLVCSYGFPWWLAPVISGVVFAGSVEFLLIGMLAAASPIGAIALTTFLVNFRHLFYGLSFPLSRVTGRIGKCYSIFALCDEAYALLSARDPETLSSARILWTQAGLHLSWATGALVGGLVGTNLLRNIAGLGFASTALFLVLAIDAFRSRHDIATLLAALTCAGIALVTPGSSCFSSLWGCSSQCWRSATSYHEGNSMSDPTRIALALAAAVVTTVCLRAAPFALTKAISGSALLTDIGHWMPPGAITILTVYCLAEIDGTDSKHCVPEIAAVLMTVLVHLWRRNAVLSIVTGTLTCMIITNWVSLT